MFKLSVFLFMIILFNACGVDTASSQTVIPVEEPVIEEPVIDKTPSDFALIDLNPVDDNGTDIPDNNGTDIPDNNGTDIPSGVDSDFDTAGAIEDKYACIIGDTNNGYTNNTLIDDSNDYIGASDEEDGLGITSRYAYNDDVKKIEVILYYYDLKPTRSMDVKAIFEDNYILSVDTGWAYNEETILYVRTPKDDNDLYGCYRYDVKSIDNNGDYTVTKVYRVNELKG